MMRKIITKNQDTVYYMKNKKYILSTRCSNYQYGFSLIELMVATTISIIVLLACSSVFLTTFKLKEQVKTRISYGQDVRNAADLLRSDTRQLGNFNCVKPPSNNQLNQIFKDAFDASNKQFLSTKTISNNLKNIINVTPIATIDPLIMTYLSPSLANKMVFTYCNQDVASIGNDFTKNISGVVYVVGTTATNTNPSLYRVNYTDGQWSLPQLLVSNVSNMELKFNYDNHTENTCPKTINTNVNPDITTEGDLDYNKNQPPILMKATLTICPNGISSGTCVNSTSSEYVIQAMVRKGEVCAFSPLSPV